MVIKLICVLIIAKVEIEPTLFRYRNLTAVKLPTTIHRTCANHDVRDCNHHHIHINPRQFLLSIVERQVGPTRKCAGSDDISEGTH